MLLSYNKLVHLTRLKTNTVIISPQKGFKYHMTKEIGTTFFTISMIILLLAGLGFFMYLNFFVNPTTSPLTTTTYTPVTTNPVSLTLNLSSPDDNLLTFDPNLLVSGQTSANVLVLITINENNQILNASKQGDFSQTVKLTLGVNQVIVSVFDNQGNYKSEARSIYYSEEKL